LGKAYSEWEYSKKELPLVVYIYNITQYIFLKLILKNVRGLR